MFFSAQKKEIERLTKIILDQRKVIDAAEPIIGNYINLLNSFQNYGAEKLPYLDIYSVGNEVYCIFADRLTDSCISPTFLELDLTTARLTSPQPSNESVAKSHLDVNRIGDEICVELVSLDSCEPHKGHGSRQLQLIIKLSKLFNIDMIYGDLLRSTHEQYERLQSFYVKNGFEVRGGGFDKRLTPAT